MRNKRIAKLTFIIFLFSLFLNIFGCSNTGHNTPPQLGQNIISPSSEQILQLQPPQQPNNFTGIAISCNIINLKWTDNSNNEEGFKVYRDNILIVNLGDNITTYQDTDLKANTTYYYSILAYNQAGDSMHSSLIIKTPNPPITVRLNGIGVYDNRENWTRGEDGEVYIYMAISDGNSSTRVIRFPQFEGQHYKLAKNETTSIGTIIFSTNEVGDYLTFTIIGYEDDGGGFEPFVYQALGIAIESELPGGTGLVLDAFNVSLSGLIGQFFGEEDDWLGSFEHTWDSDTNWGIGEYNDIPCIDERGIQCLRLWFSIASQ